MKKITLTLISVLAAGALAMAKGPGKPGDSAPGFAVMKSGSSLFKIIYKADEAANVQVTIFNDKRDRVFSEVIRKRESFLRPYNFENLPEGEYTIELQSPQGKQVQAITHHFSSPSSSFFHVTRIDSEEDRYLITATGEDEITVRITDDNNQVLRLDRHEVKGEFAKVYNMKKVSRPFTIEVSDRQGKSAVVN
jgi:hypothetical protein